MAISGIGNQQFHVPQFCYTWMEVNKRGAILPVHPRSIKCFTLSSCLLINSLENAPGKSDNSPFLTKDERSLR